MLRKLIFTCIVAVLILSTSVAPAMAEAQFHPTPQFKLVLDPIASGFTTPYTWDMLIAPFKGQLYAAVFTSQVSLTMLRSSDGKHWQQAGVAGLGYSGTYGDALSIFVFKGNLYMTLQGWTDPTLVIRSADGVNWETVYTASDGVGTEGYANNPDKMGVFDGMLYITTTGASARVLRSRSGDPGSWQMTDDSLGTGVFSSSAPIAFKGFLYISDTDASGVHVWRSWDGLHWTQVGQGVLDDPSNENDGNLVVFKGNLYFSTDYNGWGNPTHPDTSAGHIYRSGDGIHWQMVEPKGPDSIFPNPTEFDSLFVYQGQLYAFSYTYVAEGYPRDILYRSSTGNTGDWAKVNPDGIVAAFTGRGQQVVFNNSLYIATFYYGPPYPEGDFSEALYKMTDQ